jgi:hypothetical protein
MGTAETTIVAELHRATDTLKDWRELGISHAPVIHIAVMSEPFLSYVFEGKKTVESRFSLHKIAPYQKVQPSNIILMKAGPIVGSFKVGWVRYFNLKEETIEELRHRYGTAICGDEAFWQTKADKHYATLIGITEVTQLSPVTISKSDRRGWLTLEDPGKAWPNFKQRQSKQTVRRSKSDQ